MKTTKAILAFAILGILMMSFSYPVSKWDLLGSKKVNYGLDRDEIKVTLKEGTFRKIKIKVKKSPVHFKKVVVHYRNGSKEELNFRDKIYPGKETRAMDLNGNNRIIQKVVFYYHSQPRARGKGIVQLYGMH